MIILSDEIKALLERERDNIPEDGEEHGPLLMLRMMEHESHVLHKGIFPYSSIYPDFVDGRAAIFTTVLTEYPWEVMTIATLENDFEGWL